MNNNEIEYVQQVLMEKLQEEAGKYVAQEMIKIRSDKGDVMATLLGGLMEDSSIEPNCRALTIVINILEKMKANESNKE